MGQILGEYFDSTPQPFNSFVVTFVTPDCGGVVCKSTNWCLLSLLSFPFYMAQRKFTVITEADLGYIQIGSGAVANHCRAHGGVSICVKQLFFILLITGFINTGAHLLSFTVCVS